MDFFNKYSYLRAVFVGIPFGIACLIMGVWQFYTIPENIDSFCINKGIVEANSIEKYRVKGSDLVYEGLFLKLNSGSRFYVDVVEKRNRITNKLKESSKNSVVIWTKVGEMQIRQISINGEMVIEYKPPYWIAHFFGWLGLVLTTASIIGVVKNPEYLFGSKEKINDFFDKPWKRFKQ